MEQKSPVVKKHVSRACHRKLIALQYSDGVGFLSLHYVPCHVKAWHCIYPGILEQVLPHTMNSGFLTAHSSLRGNLRLL